MSRLGEAFPRALEVARKGDEGGFTDLFRSVQPALLRYLRVLAGGQAEDVASETWVRVVHDLHRFSGDEDGFHAWVFTIARHRWLDARRAASRRPVAAYDDAATYDLPAPRTVDEEVEEAMATEAALALLRRLPPDQAEAVLLRVVAGLDVEKVAAITGRRPGHVRVLSHRGLKRLAALLHEGAPV